MVKKAKDLEVTAEDSANVTTTEDHAAITNKKAHDLGVKWGKESAKRNGQDMKYLRQALEIINTVPEVKDVCDAYKESGGDAPTVSKIKKILTLGLADPAVRAVVFDESSNSLQGCYAKVRNIEKGTEQIDDGEGELPLATTETRWIPSNVDPKELIMHLDEVREVVDQFAPDIGKLLQKAMKKLEEYQADNVDRLSPDEVMEQITATAGHGKKRAAQHLNA